MITNQSEEQTPSNDSTLFFNKILKNAQKRKPAEREGFP